MNQNQYILPVGETLSTAWQKVKGLKATFWGAFAIIVLITIGFGILFAIADAFLPSIKPVIKIIDQILISLLQIGTLYIGINRAYDLPVSFKQMFRSLQGNIALSLILTYILQVLILLPVILIGFGVVIAYHQDVAGSGILSWILIPLCAILAIYLVLRMLLAYGFVLEKGVGPVTAIKSSFAATRKNFWHIFGLFLLQNLIVIISIIPLGLGLIWTMPLVINIYGEMYRYLSRNVNLPANPQPAQ